MDTVFISGSIRIRGLDAAVLREIEGIASGGAVIIGDASGVDSAIQEHLLAIGAPKVTVYCSGRYPRNNVGNWRVRAVATNAPLGTKAYFTAKDERMARDCSRGFMVWDAESMGTLKNVLVLVKSGKPSRVYVHPRKELCPVGNVGDLRTLTAAMNRAAWISADEHLGLTRIFEEAGVL